MTNISSQTHSPRRSAINTHVTHSSTMWWQASMVTVVTLVLLGPTRTTATSSLPLLYAKGTHYEVGWAMGNTFHSQIRSFFANDSLIIDKLIPFSNTPTGQKVVAGYLSVLNTSYPQYVEEMEGIAQGSGVEFLTIFLNMMRRELKTLMGSRDQEADHCTDIHVRHDDFRALAHNEDGGSGVLGHAYMLTAVYINDRPRGKLTVANESFTSYVYPGMLPGSAFGFNQYGLAMAVNALYPKLCLTDSTGHYFLARAALSAKTVEDVIRILENSGFGTAYGESFNVAELSTQRLYNIEIAPWAERKQTLLNVTQVTPGAPNKGNYFHVNMYRRLKVSEDPALIVSSEHRTARIQAMPSPQDKQGMLAILGDTTDKAFPIYRHLEEDGSSTLATAYFDMARWTMAVYLDNPSTSAGPIHTFTIPHPQERH